MSFDHLDAVLAHQHADALDQPSGYLTAAVHRRAVVSLEPCDGEAELLATPQQGDDLGVAQERLGRNAPPVEAHPAQVFLLDQGDLQPQLGSADGGHVAARPRADDGDVVGLFH